MDKYRKVKVAGKGSFGYALLVQSVADRKLYIMKVIDVTRMDNKQKEEALKLAGDAEQTAAAIESASKQ